MSKTMVQIRNVPVEFHRRLKARAAMEGMSMSDYKVGVHVPHLADVEVTQVLRRATKDGELNAATAFSMLNDFRALDLQRHAHEPLLERVWQLRNNLSAYDAVYIALAEALDCVLLTCDARLSRAPGLRHRVELVRVERD